MRCALLTIALATLALAGVARAEPLPRLDLAPKPDANLAALNAAVVAPDRQSHALPQPGIAKTAIEGQFARKGASGAIGFLCGRPDSLDERAASQPLGSDPQGRFLGARLAFSFR